MKRSLTNLIFSLAFVCFSFCRIQNESTIPTEASNNTNIELQIEDVKEDTFLLEIQYLKEEVKLNQQKIKLIEQLRSFYLENNLTIPIVDLQTLNDLSTDSFYSPIIPVGYTPPRYHVQPSYNQGDQESFKEREEQFKNRIFKKFALDFDVAIKEMMYLPTKNMQRATDEPPTSSLIVFLTAKDEILLYNLNGYFLHSFDAGHSVKRFAVNTFQEDYFIATLGTDNTIRVHNITMTKVKVDSNVAESAASDKPVKRASVSRFTTEYGSALNFAYDLENNLVINQDEDLSYLSTRKERDYGSLSFILGKSIKFFAVVNEEGALVLFQRNGQYKGQFKFPDARLLSIQKHFPNPIYATDKAVGFFNPNMLEIMSPYCDPPGETILKLELDQFSTSSFYILLANGDVLFYEIKQSSCKVVAKRSIHASPEGNPQDFDVVSAKNFLLMQSNKQSTHILAHNVTDAAFTDLKDIEYFNITLAPQTDDEIVKSNYITQRSSFTSSSVGAYSEYKNGSSSFSLYDINIPTKQSNDWFSNFRLPVVFVAVLLAIGYQFWSKKKKREEDVVMKTLSKYNFDKKAETDIGSLKDSIDSLAKQTNRMQEELGNISAKALSQMAGARKELGTIKDEYEYDEDEIQEITTDKYV